MARRVSFSGRQPLLQEIATHYKDLESSLRFYFCTVSQDYEIRFAGYSLSEAAAELTERLDEVDLTACLAVLASIEAAFRIDYLQRCYGRAKDPVSRVLRDIYKAKRERASLEDEILEVWARNSSVPRSVISDLRGAFRFRHWLAHGRYWVPKLGRQYDYNSVFNLAELALNSFPLYGFSSS